MLQREGITAFENAQGDLCDKTGLEKQTMFSDFFQSSASAWSRKHDSTFMYYSDMDH